MTDNTEERAKSYKECLAFPDEIPDDCVWTPEADMLMQINESVLELNETLVSVDNTLAKILKLFENAADAAASYIESKGSNG